MVATKKEEAMPRRAYSYLRYSFSMQRKGRSVKRQHDWAEAFARQRGWFLADDAKISDEAMSAFRGKNRDTGALAAFLADVKAKLVPAGSVLLVESLDRLSREEVDEAYTLWRGLLKAGISIQTREPERFYDATKSFSMLDMLEVLFIAARAHEESATKSMRICDSWVARRNAARQDRKPHGARAPRWLVLRDGRYEFREGAREVYRQVFLKSAEGLGSQRIAEWMTAHGYRDEGSASGRWAVSTIDNILTRREAVGEYQPRKRDAHGVYRPEGEPVIGYYPALVSENEWNAANEARGERKQKRGRPPTTTFNLFTGIVYHAGSLTRAVLTAVNATSNGVHYTYHGVAQGEGRTLPPRQARRWRYDWFEAGVLEAIEELDVRDVLPPDAAIDEADKRVGELARRLVSLDRRAAMLKAVIANPDTSEQDAADAQDTLRAVRADQQASAAEHATLKLRTWGGKGEGLEALQALLPFWRESRGGDEGASLGERLRVAIARLVGEIWVLPQRLNQLCTVLHCQLYLRSGERRYLQILPPSFPEGGEVWQLEALDFRAGQVSHATADAEALA